MSNETKSQWLIAVQLRITAVLATMFCCGVESRGTEFGGVANLDYPTNVLNHVFQNQWKEIGNLTWIRNSSKWLATHGLNCVSVITFAPEWARANGGRDLPDNLLALYWHFRANLPVYPGVRQAWEIWNEPDFHFVRDNPDRMAACLKAAYWGIKAGNSNAIVLMPSLAFNPDKYPRELARNNIYPYTEGYNFHYYGWAHDFLPSLAAHRRFMKEHGWNLPIWVTEAGYFHLKNTDANDPTNLARQQAFHERLTISAYAAGVDRYLPFILTPYTEEGFDLSMMTRDLEPRPALDSYLYLSRQLPGTRPLYQIFHRPTQSVIGFVLGETNGTWWTVLWSPYRWHDFSLPPDRRTGSLKAVPKLRAAMGDEPESAKTVNTALNLVFRFPKGINEVRTGLKGGNILKNLSDIAWTVSAESNLFLRTPPMHFAIDDCEWRAIQSGEAAEPDWERTTSTIAVRPDARDGWRRGAASNTHDACAPRQPSPVVLQFDYEKYTVTPHKPSQTYRYNPKIPLLGTLNLYNLSEQTQTGSWSAELPAGWTLWATGDRRPETGSTNEPSFRFVIRASKLVTLPPVSKVSLPLQLIPLNAHNRREPSTKREHRKRELLGMQLRPRAQGRPMSGRLQIGDTAECNSALRGGELIVFRWNGKDGTTDQCATWLEPDRISPQPNIILPLQDWFPIPEFPDQWRAEFPDKHTGLFSLKKLDPYSEMASFFIPMPSDLVLEDDDLLRAEIRANPARPTAYYRINLLTQNKEVFRYTETLAFGNYWTPISYRIGDFGPFFWSRVESNGTAFPCEPFEVQRSLFAVRCSRVEIRNSQRFDEPIRGLSPGSKSVWLPTERFRYLRISVGGVQPGDTVEIRNLGIFRASQ